MYSDQLLQYSKVWSVRNRGLGFARLDFLSGLRNRAFARPQFLILTKESAKIFFAACGGDNTVNHTRPPRAN